MATAATISPSLPMHRNAMQTTPIRNSSRSKDTCSLRICRNSVSSRACRRWWVGVAAQLEALQQAPPARRRGQRQEQLADGAAMQRHARAASVVQPQRPVLGLDAVEIDHFAVEQRANIAGLVQRVHQALQHHVRRVVTHRGDSAPKARLVSLDRRSAAAGPARARDSPARQTSRPADRPSPSAISATR